MRSKLLLALGFVLLLSAFAGLGAYLAWDFVKRPGSAEAREVIYEVRPGRSFQAVSRDLETMAVVRHAEAFSIYARVVGLRGSMKVGEYRFSTSMSPPEVLQILVSGKSIARPLTIPEGRNLFDVAEIIEKAGLGSKKEFLELARNRDFIRSLLGEELTSLEGYLFPETYQVTKYMGLKEVVAAMVRRFLAVYKDIESLASSSGFTRHQLVTFASLVEKETGAPFERPLIASVFHNRLAKKMRLQTDPTILYGMAMETGTMPLNITRADILRPTAYNTYTIPALPPGPICNPGREALLAVLKPESSEFLFFVSRNDGTHVFSKTYQDHNQAVRQFQLDPKAREGKSWRDLTKDRKPQD